MLVGACLGVALVLVGLAWPAMIQPRHVWTPEQAAEFQAASDALQHGAVGAERSPDAATTAPANAIDPAARRRFDAINAQLEAARYARDGWGRVAVACGLGLTILCGFGYLAVRGD